MKHNPHQKRGRSRGNGKRNPSNRNSNFESSGGDNKIRGSAQQVLDKYLAMARDAQTAGDRIASEYYFQFADHYYRIVNANNSGDGQGGQNRGNRRDHEKQSPDAAKKDDVKESAPQTQAAPEAQPEPDKTNKKPDPVAV